MIQTDRYTIDRLNTLPSGRYRLLFDGCFRGTFGSEAAAFERVAELILEGTRKARAEYVAGAASDAFWAKVAELVPEAKYGDLDPGETHAIDRAMRRAVDSWLISNLPEESKSERATRPLKVGDRVRILKDKVIVRSEFGAGETGTVLAMDGTILIHLDRHIEELDEWGNDFIYATEDIWEWEGINYYPADTSGPAIAAALVEHGSLEVL